jgi:hypothetical protein
LIVAASGLLGSCGASQSAHRTKTVVRTVPAPATPASTEQASSPKAAALEKYTASLYTARIPKGWPQEADQEQHSGYVESKWRDPSDSSTSLTIDAAAGESTSPSAKADEVSAAVRRSSDYSELSYQSASIAGHDGFKWEFRVSGSKRVDYFLNDCSTGIAVLGSTSPSRYSALQATFRRVAESVHATCTTPPQSTPPPTATAPSAPSEAGFCDTHDCIPNFDNGTGYIVQCKDGMWSHSGGRPGACSYHGGESSTTYP